MTDKTELTREEVERLGSTVGGSPLAVEVLPGTWRWYKWPPPPEWEQALAMAPVAYRQLLAAMDDRDRHLNNLGRFVSQVAMALGLPAASAPEVVLRQAAVTFDGAHRYANERDRLQTELAEARAALAAERGEAEGAPSEGWEYSVEHAEWRKRSGGVRLLVEHAAPNCWQWTLDEYENDYGWYEDMAGNRGDAESMLAREAMRAADAALTAMEPPDAD